MKTVRGFDQSRYITGIIIITDDGDSSTSRLSPESRSHFFTCGPTEKTWLLAEFSTITKRDFSRPLA